MIGTRPSFEGSPSKNISQQGIFENGRWFCACTPRKEAKLIQTKKEGPNTGRWFYRCTSFGKEDCKFFLWQDEAATRVEFAEKNPTIVVTTIGGGSNVSPAGGSRQAGVASGVFATAGQSPAVAAGIGRAQTWLHRLPPHPQRPDSTELDSQWTTDDELELRSRASGFEADAVARVGSNIHGGGINRPSVLQQLQDSRQKPGNSEAAPVRTGDDDVEMQSIFGGGDTVSSRAPFSVPANTVVGESVGDGGDGGAAGGAGQLRSPESSQKQPQLQQQEELLKTPPSTKRTHHVFSGNNQQQQQLHTPVSGSGLGERDERSSTTLLALTSSQKRPRMTWQPPGTPTPAPRMGLGVVGEVGSVGGGPRSSFTVQGVQDTPSKAWTTSFTTVNNDDDPFTAADVGPDHEQTQHILGLLIPSYSSLPLDGGEGNLTIDPPITRASLAAARAALNALARRADGYVRGRDSARDALRRRDARIAEMQGRLVELERKLALEREVVRRLIEEAGRAAVSAERAGGGSRAGDGDSGDQGNGGGDGEEIAMQDSYGSTEARQ